MLPLDDETRRSLLLALDSHHGIHKDVDTPGHAGAVAESDPESDSQLVLRRIVDCGRYASRDEIDDAVDEYIRGKPLAYITGTHAFGPLSLSVRPPVYIPRIETEQWVLLLGRRIHSLITGTDDQSSTSTATSTSTYSATNPFRILDICSGSGCIPLLLAHLGQGLIHTVGLEVDDRALEVARENAERNGVDHVARFEKFDLFDDSDEARDDLRRRIAQREDARGGGGRYGFDMVVSNPPYVSSEDMRKVEKTWHEGRFALQGKLRRKAAGSSSGGSGSGGGGGGGSSSSRRDGEGDAEAEAVGDDEDVTDGDDGYSFYRRIKEVYSDFLDNGVGDGDGDGPSAIIIMQELPKLVLEVGATQSRPVQEMYASEGRLEVRKETARRREIGAPKLEEGDMVGTERSVWVYRR